MPQLPLDSRRLADEAYRRALQQGKPGNRSGGKGRKGRNLNDFQLPKPFSDAATTRIGGMVHEMNVPYIMPDLQLPPVGSAPQQTTNPQPSAAQSNLRLYAARAISALAVVLIAVLAFARRRRA